LATLDELLHTWIRALRLTLSAAQAAPAMLERIATLAVTAPCILIFGLGGSNAVAQDTWHKFVRTGLPCEAPSDFHMQLMVASQARPGSLVILFSHTGSNTDALAIVDEARQSGATIVVVTSHQRSPLARKADMVLVSKTPPVRYVSEAWSARIAQLALVDSLYVLMMEKLGDKGNSNLESMRKAMARRRL
jgi:DNA-binding MurR/RpiR family transcriptional regulator